MAAEAGLEFVATLRDQASDAAARLKRNMADVGGSVPPVKIPVHAPDSGPSVSALRRIEGGLEGLEGAAKRGVSVLAGAGKAMAAGLAVAAGGAIAGGAALYGQGVQIDALGRKAETVFGDQMGAAKGWAEANAASMGLTKSAATGLAAGMADLLIPMGFTREAATKLSTETVGLSGALSEWTGGTKSAAEVTDILQAAFLGETDGLKALGISLSAAEIEAGLVAKGQDKLTGAALQQAQALVIQESILAKSTDAQAAYAKGGDAPIRTQAKLKAQALELKDTFATALLPATNAVAGGLLSMAQGALPQVEKGLATAGSVAANLAKQIPNLAGALRDGDLGGAAEVLDNIFGNTGDKIPAFRAGLETAASVGRDLADVFRSSLGPALADTGTILPAFLTPLGLLRAALGFMAEHSTTTRIAFTALGVALLVIIPGMRVLAAVTAVASAAKAAYAIATLNGATMEQMHTRALIMNRVATVQSAAASVAGAASTAAAWVASGARTVASSVAAGASLVATWVVGGARAAASAVASAATTAAAWVASGLRAVASMAVTVAAVVGGWVLMGAQAMLAAARMAAAWLIALGPIGLAIAAVIAIAVLVVKNWDTIKAATARVWDWIGDKLSAVWSFVRGLVTSAGAAVTGAVTGAWDRVRAATSAAWDWIVSKIAGVIVSVLGHVNRVREIVGTVAGAFGSARDAAVGKLGELLSFVGGLPGRVIGAVSGMAGAASGIGRDIIDGIIRGVQNGVGALAGAARSAAKSALDAAIGFLKIGSPSRVFRDEVGAMIPAGLAIGIRANTSSATAAAAKMAASVARAGSVSPDAARFTNALSPAALSVTATAGQTMTIRHEIVSPDGSVSDLDARQIADLIARDPRAAERIEGALRVRRDRRASTSIGGGV